MEILEGERVIAFDLETTGISTSRDRIVQLALIGSDVDGTEISYDRLVNPRRPIPYDSQRIHGISDADVRGEPDFAQIADSVSNLIEGCVLIGHNVRQFDLPMLRNEFLRIGALPPEPKAVLDTLEMVRRLKLPRPHRLGAQCNRHGISLENAHTASADAAHHCFYFGNWDSIIQVISKIIEGSRTVVCNWFNCKSPIRSWTTTR